MIDQALEQKPADFDALLKLLEGMGCEVSRRGQSYAHATREAKRTSARLLDKVVGTA